MNKKFAIINCEPDKNAINTAELYLKHFSTSNNECWKIYDVTTICNDISFNKTTFHGIILTGSHYNVTELIMQKCSWFLFLCYLIRKAYLIGSPNIFGTCFGSQIIAYSLGGKIQRNNEFILKSKKINLTLQGKKYMNELPNVFHILSSHHEIIEELPKCKYINNLGVSYNEQKDNCENSNKEYINNYTNELFLVKDNILGCQGHPEITNEYKNILWDRHKDKISNNNLHNNHLSILNHDDQNCKILLHIIKNFLCH